MDATRFSPTRRAMLKLGVSVASAAGGGLLLGFGLPAAGRVVHSVGAPFAPNAFVRIGTDGGVTLIMPKVEMGQGIYTSIPMLIAEELEVLLENVRLEHAPPDESRFKDSLLASQMTGGSTSIRYAWEPMRMAGATARTLLITAAAQVWRVELTSCYAEKGAVVHKATGRRIPYGQLVEAAAKLDAPKNVALKTPQQFRLIGTRQSRLDGRGKVDGSARFGLDVRLPNMLYAAIVPSPVFGGTVVKIDDAAAQRIPGVRQVVSTGGAVAVIAVHSWAARRGADALVVQWNEGGGASYSTEAMWRELENAIGSREAGLAKKEGDVAQAMAKARKTFEASYQQPLLAHATMEPVNCTVHVRPHACDIWVGTQVPTRAVAVAARLTGLPERAITLHNHLLGGGFGRRLETDFIEDAVKVARKVDGPVKVFWTRERDIQGDMYRPAYYDRLSAGLDVAGKPIAWRHRIAGSSIMARFAPPLYSKGVDLDAVDVAADLPYQLPNQLVEFIRQEPGLVPTAFWRGVGGNRSSYAVESFIDELAHRAGSDPVVYRSALLASAPRARAVLETAARLSGWNTPLPKGEGRGVAVMHAFGTYIAAVVHVAVDAGGEVAVKRVVCAVDCGVVVNPDTVEAQIEGGVMFGLSAALYGEITIRDGRTQQSNFHDYRVLRIDQAPPVNVHIMPSTEAPGGIGEPGTAILSPALVNAIYAAAGRRIRKLPVAGQLRSA